MANDKDFILKNAVEVGGSTKSTLGTVTSNDVDLSTGNYFAHTPGGATTYTFSNPADVQSFQLEVTGGLDAVAQAFNTTIISPSFGDTITTNLNMSGDGGLVWAKQRNDTYAHVLVDTERGGTKYLQTNTGAAQATDNATIPSFTSTGFNLGSDAKTATGNMVYWSWKKTTNVFDIVTYSGSASNQNISHNLGTTPGMIIIKSYDQAYDWAVRHRSLSSGNNIILNSTGGDGANGWFPTDPTSTQFTVKGGTNAVNQAGANYVAYLFGHDTSSDGLIYCGNYTGTGATGNSINLGWQPQWIIIKRTNTTGQWRIFDDQRGVITDGYDQYLIAEQTVTEGNNSEDSIDFTSTGFTLKSSNTNMNASGSNYIYMAIRDTEALSLTWPSAIQWAGGLAPAAPGTNETDLYTFTTDDGGTTYHGFKTADNFS